MTMLALACASLLRAQDPAPPCCLCVAGEVAAGSPGERFGDLPFRDLADGRRLPGQGAVARADTQDPAPWVHAGHAQPCTLHWTPQPGAVAQLLSCRTGDAVLRREVTGQESCEVTFRAPVRECTVESLLRQGEGSAFWISRVQNLPVDVRGVAPLAGEAHAQGEHRDGQGTWARFREAFDVERVPAAGCCGPDEWHLVVTDPRAHVLRRVTFEGKVSTLCGMPDQPGHQDSPGLRDRLGSWLRREKAPPPRFNRPTYLALRKNACLADKWEILVADSGNHAIRRVGLDGRVATFAGTVGWAGHFDADDPTDALFNDPQGIAVDAQGNTYVADHGNFVIRRIARDGRVTTVAGAPGRAGILDGVQASAHFSDLRGLAWKPEPGQGGILYVLDGHALRVVSLPDGVVATVLGQVAMAGFQDLAVATEDQAVRQPCLNDPLGLRYGDGRLFIADTGNHAIRMAFPEGASLKVLQTLVGDPGAAETRWGLLRDGLPGPLGPGYATLAAPTAVACGPRGPACSLVACAGSGLAEIDDWREARDCPCLTEVECVPENRAGSRTVRVAFRVQTLGPLRRTTVHAFGWSVDFLDPGGRLAERKEGTTRGSAVVTVQGAFAQAGKGSVVIRCVTDEGVSAGTRVPVAIGE